MIKYCTLLLSFSFYHKPKDIIVIAGLTFMARLVLWRENERKENYTN
jgi:hypothetical protein